MSLLVPRWFFTWFWEALCQRIYNFLSVFVLRSCQHRTGRLSHWKINYFVNFACLSFDIAASTLMAYPVFGSVANFTDVCIKKGCLTFSRSSRSQKRKQTSQHTHSKVDRATRWVLSSEKPAFQKFWRREHPPFYNNGRIMGEIQLIIVSAVEACCHACPFSCLKQFCTSQHVLYLGLGGRLCWWYGWMLFVLLSARFYCPHNSLAQSPA